MSTVQKDVLGLLNLSPGHKSEGPERLSTHDPPNGHPELEARPSDPPTNPIRLPSGNGYKFLSPGRFFPSSKC